MVFRGIVEDAVLAHKPFNFVQVVPELFPDFDQVIGIGRVQLGSTFFKASAVK